MSRARNHSSVWRGWKQRHVVHVKVTHTSMEANPPQAWLRLRVAVTATIVTAHGIGNTSTGGSLTGVGICAAAAGTVLRSSELWRSDTERWTWRHLAFLSRCFVGRQRPLPPHPFRLQRSPRNTQRRAIAQLCRRDGECATHTVQELGAPPRPVAQSIVRV